MGNIFSVAELTANIKGSLEKHFPFVWVKGEVSNLAHPSSGHLYFALKDQDALLNCVWFKHAQRTEEKFDPLTGEVFEDGPRPSMAQKLQNGQEILCAGSISLYAPRGAYQLIVSLVQEGGRGALYAAFEALKAKLEVQGYFSQARKRALPAHPRRVAVITAPGGAAIQDFLRIASLRGLGNCIDIYPVPVQGDAAAPAIVKAFAQIEKRLRHDANNAPEVIVLIRGGGSLEDLWAFNEEMVAQAIFTSSLPVLTGIGHEVDISIADLTADVRAATPTHAAQLLWLLRDEYMQRLDTLELALQSVGERIMEHLSEKLLHKEQALRWLSPLQAWQRKEESLQKNIQKLQWYKERILENKDRALENLEKKLPYIVNAIHSRENTLSNIILRLEHGTQNIFLQKEHILQKMEVELKACDPLSPLNKGYALVQDVQGNTLRSVKKVQSGQDICLQLADGNIDALVKKITKNKSS